MKRSWKNLVIPLALTFILMALLVVFTSKVIFRTAFSSVQELGEDKAMAITADLENYLETAKSVLWLAADTVDHMVEKGATDEEIIEYITRESTRTEEQFDESYTGIYGVIRGTYVDGVGWEPPEDYDPTQRDWYLTTVAGKGEVQIVNPYVDAQTGNVIISIGRALTDNRNALALDLTLNGVQEIVEKIQINGYGYGYILNHDGMVIAHHDKEENGKYYNELPEYRELYEKVLATRKGNFDIKLNGEDCTVFVDEVMDQWHLVIVTRNSELYKDPMFLLFISILINSVIFVLISIFYILGYRNERKSHDRMEEMKELERKKDYEAKILEREKQAADSANKAKSDFLADMSHEIRTPINAILGMNEMILHESKEQDTLDYASNIKSAGNTLLSIINTILDFSKIEDGRMSLVPVEFETAGLLTGLVNSINSRVKAKQLKLILDIDPSVPAKLKGDDVRISQVIMNILTNAVKYTEHGEIRFTMKNLGPEGAAESGEGKDSTRLLISVKDTGIGIKQEDMNRLFVSFERLDEEKNRHIEGTGLGMTIVTRLLKMMDSELKLKSEYGVGSEFYFELPVEVVDPSPLGEFDPDSRSISKAENYEITISAPRARILLTDDNALNCRVAANLMKLFGITPTICRSGEETIRKMREGQYDILFLDHMMPQMDGMETLKILIRDALVGDTKIIVLTANAVVGAKEQYLAAGFDDYLSKPIDLPDLEKMLKTYLPQELIEGKLSETTVKHTVQSSGTGTLDEIKRETKERRNRPDIRDEDFDEPIYFEPMGNIDPEFFGAAEEEAVIGEGLLEHLREMGLDVDAALNYCGNDPDFYLEVLRDYVEAAPERMESLTAYLQEGNLKDYEVLVHSLKSASKTIGAMELFEKARDLEFAAAEGKEDFIRENHEQLLRNLEELVFRLKKEVSP